MMQLCRFFADWRLRLLVVSLPALLAGCAGPEPGSSHVLRLAPEHRQEVVMIALGLMGSPYRYGGNHPASGFDCSGLVNYVFHTAAGASVPRTSGKQATAARRVSRGQLREGDLVFFNTLGRPNSHVGIYIGDGRFINAPSSGGHVRIDRLDNPYFSRRFDSARTLFADG